ncbi:MAG: hypothetical protein C5B52_01075 [Bacteroidetes bacterium]|nr:MAG: hypothetical protein C5B52_01075 [Bacteroidota bacterium]
MKTPNRDLLVLLRDEFMSEQAIEHEVEQLNEILFHVESVRNFCMAHEIVDLNKYKILSTHKFIVQVVKQKELKPFQFISNKN